MSSGFPIRSGILKGLYCLCSENKGPDQLYFAYAKSRFSHEMAHMVKLLCDKSILYCQITTNCEDV